jgi:hypothetical protein
MRNYISVANFVLLPFPDAEFSAEGRYGVVTVPLTRRHSAPATSRAARPTAPFSPTPVQRVRLLSYRYALLVKAPLLKRKFYISSVNLALKLYCKHVNTPANMCQSCFFIYIFLY